MKYVRDEDENYGTLWFITWFHHFYMIINLHYEFMTCAFRGMWRAMPNGERKRLMYHVILLNFQLFFKKIKKIKIKMKQTMFGKTA